MNNGVYTNPEVLLTGHVFITRAKYRQAHIGSDSYQFIALLF